MRHKTEKIVAVPHQGAVVDIASTGHLSRHAETNRHVVADFAGEPAG